MLTLSCSVSSVIRFNRIDYEFDLCCFDFQLWNLFKCFVNYVHVICKADRLTRSRKNRTLAVETGSFIVIICRVI